MTVLVTGAGSGIGRAIARMIGAADANVVCIDVRGALDTAAAIDGAVAYRFDVRDRDAWAGAVRELLDERDRIDALCNVAGVLARGSDTVEGLVEDEWNRVLDVNLKGCWLGMQATCPAMARGGRGRVVNVASIAGSKGIAGLAAYSASKMGMIGLSRSAAVEFAGRGVLINVVAPGFVEPPAGVGPRRDKALAAAREATPTERLGGPDDVARMCLHLLGPGGDFATGSVFTIDGGYSVR